MGVKRSILQYMIRSIKITAVNGKGAAHGKIIVRAYAVRQKILGQFLFINSIVNRFGNNYFHGILFKINNRLRYIGG